MQLNYRKFGDSGRSIIIMHGLYGSMNNWFTIANNIAQEHTVFALDMRNHGNSPHSTSHSYSDLCEDLSEFITEHNIKDPILIGHSMGGKAVARLAYEQPNLVSKIIVVDISPFGCENGKEITDFHKHILHIMGSLNLSELKSRADATEQITEKLQDKTLANFLLMNLKKDAQGGFYWGLNIETILNNVNNITDAAISYTSTININTPSLFILGGKSQYVGKSDVEILRKAFSHLSIEIIADAGHWVHVESRYDFLEKIMTFIND